MTETTIARQLAVHCLPGTEPSDEAMDWIRLLLMDYAAVTSGGAQRESARCLHAATPAAAQRGELAVSALHGAPGWAAPEEAALVNGTVAHGLELDDTFEEASLHPGVVVFPAVLAVADERGSSAREVLHASLIGYDVMCGIGVLLGAAESYGRGFHPTGVAGAIGAAAAVASLLGLDEDRTVNTLGIAANLAAGSLEFLSDGSWTKRLNAGHAASVGIRAARLGAAGFLAPQTAFEGRDGFLTQHGQGLIEGRELRLELGRAALDTSIKFYPCCRYMHGSIDLLRELHQEFPGTGIDDIERIEVGVIRAGATLVSLPPERKLSVRTPVDAQFNMPFGAAVAFTTGQATVEQFDRAPELASDLLPWMQKVECVDSDRLEQAFPAQWQAEVKLTFADGTVVQRSEDAFVGSAGKRATWEQIADKAQGLVGEQAAQGLRSSIENLQLDQPISGQVSFPVLTAVAG